MCSLSCFVSLSVCRVLEFVLFKHFVCSLSPVVNKYYTIHSTRIRRKNYPYQYSKWFSYFSNEIIFHIEFSQESDFNNLYSFGFCPPPLLNTGPGETLKTICTPGKGEVNLRLGPVGDRVSIPGLSWGPAKPCQSCVSQMDYEHVSSVPSFSSTFTFTRWKRKLLPWLVWLSGLSVSLWIEKSLVQFPIRAHAWVVGQVLQRGCVRQLINVSLTHRCFSSSLSPSFSLSLKIIINKKDSWILIPNRKKSKLLIWLLQVLPPQSFFPIESLASTAHEVSK